MVFWVKVSYQKYFCNCSQNEHRSQSVFDVRTLCYKLCLCFFYVFAVFVLSTNHIRPWRENIKTFYSTEKPSYNPPPVFPVKALKFKDVRLKLMFFCRISSDPEYEHNQPELQIPPDLCKLDVNSIMRDSDSWPG